MDEINNIWDICPICGESLDGFVVCYGTAKCPMGHYEYHGLGNYASEAVVILNGVEERFFFDDGWDDERKFEERIRQLRKEAKCEWSKEGF